MQLARCAGKLDSVKMRAFGGDVSANQNPAVRALHQIAGALQQWRGQRAKQLGRPHGSPRRLVCRSKRQAWQLRAVRHP